MIRLIDILKVQGIELGSYKIHLATTGSTSPLEAYLQNKFKEWQEDQNGKNFQCEMNVALIYLSDDRWIFAGVYTVLGVTGEKPKCKYSTELLPGQGDLVGRIIVGYKRKFRNSYIWGEKYGSELKVTKLLELPYAIEEFKGYNKVQISHRKLQMIVQSCEESWRSSLSSVNGVYHILDNKTGKAYVGSAYGTDGIWGRWCLYSGNGLGKNKELHALLEEKGASYADNFQYAILEIADPSVTNEQLIHRENHWKKVLRTREFGYNLN